MEVSDIPKAWRNALAAVQLLYPDAAMAGGCLRDRELGLKVKDIDIFIEVPISLGRPTVDVLKQFADNGWQDVTLNGDESYALPVDRAIRVVLDTVYPGCPPINIIGMSKFSLDEFDWGFCQIMFNGKTIFRSPAYVRDIQTRRIRLIPKVSDAAFVRSLQRWARLKEKFPNWVLDLGSRAETRAGFHDWYLSSDSWDGRSLPSPSGRFSHRAPNIQQMPKGYLFSNKNGDVIGMLPGEYVMSKSAAERLAKETTARILRTDPFTTNVTVKVDEQAAVPSAKIIAKMIEMQRELHRQAALHSRA